MGSMEKPFYLKHFTLYQEHTAQRVGTDALLLGAWPFVHSLPEQARILDVGTGTGIVSLMMAQRFAGAQIEAWEVEARALKDAERNFALSPFAPSLHLHSQDYLTAKPEDYPTFDLIISNPPYYTEGILTEDTRLTLARHVTDGLSPEVLLRTAAALLAPRGALAFISPVASLPHLRRIAVESGWRLSELVTIYSKPQEPKRTLTLWCRLVATDGYIPTHCTELTLQDESGAPSAAYRLWLQDYLL